jgi:hypothetical protein
LTPFNQPTRFETQAPKQLLEHHRSPTFSTMQAWCQDLQRHQRVRIPVSTEDNPSLRVLKPDTPDVFSYLLQEGFVSSHHPILELCARHRTHVQAAEEGTGEMFAGCTHPHTTMGNCVSVKV